jgi:hypothetical protein
MMTKPTNTVYLRQTGLHRPASPPLGGHRRHHNGAGGTVTDLAQLVIQDLAHFFSSDVVPPRKTMSITAISYLYTALGFTDKPGPLTWVSNAALLEQGIVLTLITIFYLAAKHQDCPSVIFLYKNPGNVMITAHQIKYGLITTEQMEQVFKIFYPTMGTLEENGEGRLDAPPLLCTAEELDRYASKFAAAIPNEMSSIAQVQGYLQWMIGKTCSKCRSIVDLFIPNANPEAYSTCLNQISALSFTVEPDGLGTSAPGPHKPRIATPRPSSSENSAMKVGSRMALTQYGLSEEFRVA